MKRWVLVRDFLHQGIPQQICEDERMARACLIVLRAGLERDGGIVVPLDDPNRLEVKNGRGVYRYSIHEVESQV